jgi:hypothetical protein
MNKVSKMDRLVSAFEEMLVTRGLPRLSEDEQVVLSDALMDAMDERAEERERDARRDEW